MPINRYYPPLSSIVTLEALPEELGFIQTALQPLLSNIFVKDYQLTKSERGETVSYYMVLVIFDEVGMEIPGTGFELLINPGDVTTSGQTEIPISISVQLEILKYIHSFSLEAFSASPIAFFNVIIELLDIEESELLEHAISIFTISNSISEFVTKINQANQLVGTASEIPMPTNGNQAADLAQLVQSMITSGESLAGSFFTLLFAVIEEADNLKGTLANINTLFAFKLGTDPIERVKQLFIPKINAAAQLRAALVFPRNVLVPIKPDGTVETNETIKQRLEFGLGEFTFSTEGRTGYNQVITASFPAIYPKAQIGKTGLTVGITNAKLDISRETNIPEATADGRPNDFVGAFIQDCSIGLPAKWFKQQNSTTAEIFGKNIIVGTGGLTGKVGLRASFTNPPVGTDPPELIFTLGEKDATMSEPARPGFSIGFKEFEMDFQQNVIKSSKVKGSLMIPGFKDAGGNDAKILIEAVFKEDGDFKITAAEATGIPIKIANVVQITIDQLSVGRIDDRFYLELIGDLSIISGQLAGAISKPIEIKKLVIWDDGNIEFVGGGTIVLPKPLSLKLGPVELSITAIHLGAHEQFHIDQIRKYVYIGFDGGVNVNPGGVDARGDGIKFYFTLNNDNSAGRPLHTFMRIESIRIDLIIPGNVSPEQATLLLSGYLSMKDTPTGTEYIGGIEFALPKAKIAGGAAMRLNPRVPAFLIDVHLELPAPIVLGPTGLGIYGFRGLFGQKYVASQAAAGVPVGPEWYPYYKAKIAPDYKEGIQVSKFALDDGFSVGVGATISTTAPQPKPPFSAKVFFLLSLPEVFLIQGQMQILKERIGLDSTNDPPFSFLLAITNESITVGVGVNYDMKEDSKILHLEAEVRMAFFFGNASAWYINVGTDVAPVRGVIFKDALTFEVYAFFMISGSGIKTGAGASFHKEYSLAGGILYAKLEAYLDIFGKINFKPRQVGGSIRLGGSVALRAFGIGFNLTAALTLAAEVSNPFFVTGELEVCITVKLFVKTIEKCGKIDFTWVFDSNPNTEEIELHKAGNEGSKARNMVTEETYTLFMSTGSSLPSHISIENGPYVIPMDSYIDISFLKPIRASVNVVKIGGPNGGGSTDTIPQVAGKLQPVGHEFIVEKVDVKAWNPSSGTWDTYNVYEALTPLAASGIGVTLPPAADQVNGYWQLETSGTKVNRVMMLAQSPIEWTRQGNFPIVLEDFGITSSDIFCPPEAIEETCINFEIFEPTTLVENTPYFQEGVVFSVTGDDGHVVAFPNPFGFTNGLGLEEGSSVEFLFPNPTAWVTLKLLTCARTITVSLYEKVVLQERDLNNAPLREYALIQTQTIPRRNLQKPLEYEIGANGTPFDKVVIQAGKCDEAEIECGPLYAEATDLAALLNVLAGRDVLLTTEPVDLLENPYATFYTPRLKSYLPGPHSYWVTGDPDKKKETKIEAKPIGYAPRVTIEQPRQPLVMYIGGRGGETCLLTLELLEQESSTFAWSSIVSFVDIRPDVENNVPGLNYSFLITALDKDRKPYLIRGTTTCYPIVKCVETAPTSQDELCAEAQQLLQQLQQQLIKLLAEIKRLEELCTGMNDPCDQLAEQYCHELEIKQQELIKLQEQINNLLLFIEQNCGQEPPPDGCNCQTFVFEVCFLSEVDYNFNLNIPSFNTLALGTQGMINALSQSLKPVWRPNTTYVIQVHTKDQQSQAGSASNDRYYNYGFRTVGPVGHFHQHRQEYTDLVAEDREDEFVLAKLKPYIDFEKSYPNADGSLINSKPLFYICPKLLLFFIHPHAYTMYNSYAAYHGLPAVNSSLDIIIKDPIELDAIEEPAPNWTVNSIAQVTQDVQLLNNLMNGENCFEVTNFSSLGMNLEIEVCALKPLKLYTAVFNGNLDGDIREVHTYPFQTSRYGTFLEQINSYQLKDEDGNVVRKAFYDIETAFDAATEIQPAMAIVNGTLPDTDPLVQEFIHLYDRIIDGALKMTAIEPAELTDFTMLIDSSTGNPTSGNVIGMLVRNIEPFNDPKLNGADLEQTIKVVDSSGNVDNSYKVFISKDGSKAFITNSAFNIGPAQLHIRFRYLTYNGQAYLLNNASTDEVTVLVDVDAPLTQLVTNDCGKTEVGLTESLAATLVAGASGYEFKIEHTPSAFSASYTRYNSDGVFPLFEIFDLKYSRTYSVTVRPIVSGRTTKFGPPCLIGTKNLSFVIINPLDTVQGVAAKVEVQVQDTNLDVVTEYKGYITMQVTGSATIKNNGLIYIENGRGFTEVKDAVIEIVTLSLVDTANTGFDASSTQDLGIGVYPASSIVILDPADTVQGSTITITLHALNDFGDIDTNFNDDVTLVASGSATVASGGVVNMINGIGQIQLTDNVAETVTLSLLDTSGTGLNVNSVQDVVFTLAPASQLVILNPLDSIQGIPVTVTIHAINNFNDVVTNFFGSVTLQGSGNAIIPGGGVVTITNGVGTILVNDNSPETVLLSLSDTGGTGLDVTSTQDIIFLAVGFIFEDRFNESSDLTLASHIPDLGVSWTKLIQVSGGTVKVDASDGTAQIGVGGAGTGVFYTADTAQPYPSANYYVEIKQVSGNNSDKANILAVRVQDSNNMYAARYNTTSCQLYKKQAGVWSTLGSSGPGTTNKAVIKLQVNGNVISLIEDYTVLLTATDNSFTAAGQGGFGVGAVILAADKEQSQESDNFRVCMNEPIARLFLDKFTGSGGLATHTPDEGTSWTQILNTGSSNGIVLTGGHAKKSGGGTNSSTGSFYTANIASGYLKADYEVELRSVDADGGVKTTSLGVRVQNSGNDGYFVRFSGAESRLYKRVGGIWTALGSGPSAGVPNNLIVRLRIVGNTLSFIVDGTVLITATVTDHSLAGKAGLGIGAVMVATDDERDQEVDDFAVRIL